MSQAESPLTHAHYTKITTDTFQSPGTVIEGFQSVIDINGFEDRVCALISTAGAVDLPVVVSSMVARDRLGNNLVPIRSNGKSTGTLSDPRAIVRPFSTDIFTSLYGFRHNIDITKGPHVLFSIVGDLRASGRGVVGNTICDVLYYQGPPEPKNFTRGHVGIARRLLGKPTWLNPDGQQANRVRIDPAVFAQHQAVFALYKAVQTASSSMRP